MLNLLRDEQERRRAKNRKKKVLCPYCHQHFLLGEVAFRSGEEASVFSESRLSYEEETFRNAWEARGWITAGEETVTDEHTVVEKPRYMCEDRNAKRYYEVSEEREGGPRRVADVRFRIVDENRMEEPVYDEDGYLIGCVEQIGGKSVRTEERMCPHCFCLLPNDYGKYPAKFVSILGVAGSGKTNYIAQLLGDRSVFAAMHIDVVVGADGARFEELYAPRDLGDADKVRKKLNERGQAKGNAQSTANILFADSTTTEKSYPPVFLTLYRQGDAENRITLVLCDVAGENCANQAAIQTRGEFILHSDGIILLISPEQVAHAMKDEISFAEEDGIQCQSKLTLERVFSTIHAFAMERRVLKRLWRVPMALTLSKFDCYQRATLSNGCTLSEELFDNLQYERAIFHADAQRQRDGMLNRIGVFNADTLRTPLEQYKRKKRFAIAVIGKDAETGSTVRSLRLEEPFAWFLSHWGWIPAEGESASFIRSFWMRLMSHFRG